MSTRFLPPHDTEFPPLTPSTLAAEGIGPLAGQTNAFGLNLVNYDWATWHDYEWENWINVDALLNVAVGFLRLKGIWQPSTAYDLGVVVFDPTDPTKMYRSQSVHTSGTSWTTDKPLHWVAVAEAAPPVESVFGRIGDIVALSNDYSAHYYLKSLTYSKTEVDSQQTAQDAIIGGHTTSIANRYTKAEVDASQAVQNTSITTLNTAVADRYTKAQIDASQSAQDVSISFLEAGVSGANANASLRMRWRGVWEAGTYQAHDAVQDGAFLFVAKAVTNERPNAGVVNPPTPTNWTLLTPTGTAYVHVGATAPTLPRHGQLWFATTAPTGLFMYDSTVPEWKETTAGAEASATNLSTTRTATDVTVLSSTGADVALPAATASLAGVMTAADKTKVDGEAAARATAIGVETTARTNADNALDGRLDVIEATTANYAGRNVLINGDFDIWQRGVSLPAAANVARFAADRWKSTGSGSTCAVAQLSFPAGFAYALEATYYHRVIVASVASASNYAILVQNIEDVRTLSGQTATLSFLAIADAPKNIAVELVQQFGTGGSAPVTGIGSQKIALTAAWQWFKVTFNVSSVAGKTIGTDHYLALHFWFDAGSNNNVRTASLGQQSGSFHIAHVQLEAGSVATPFEKRPIAHEQALCQRYYQRVVCTARWPAAGGSQSMETPVPYKAEMRATPTAVNSLVGGRSNLLAGSPQITSLSSVGARFLIQSAAAGDAHAVADIWNFDAEL